MDDASASASAIHPLLPSVRCGRLECAEVRSMKGGVVRSWEQPQHPGRCVCFTAEVQLRIIRRTENIAVTMTGKVFSLAQLRSTPYGLPTAYGVLCTGLTGMPCYHITYHYYGAVLRSSNVYTPDSVLRPASAVLRYSTYPTDYSIRSTAFSA